MPLVPEAGESHSQAYYFGVEFLKMHYYAFARGAYHTPWMCHLFILIVISLLLKQLAKIFLVGG